MSDFRYAAKIENANTNELITIDSYETFETAIHYLHAIYDRYIKTCNQDINVMPIVLSVIDNNKGYGIYQEYIFTDYYINGALVREGYSKIVTPFMG